MCPTTVGGYGTAGVPRIPWLDAITPLRPPAPLPHHTWEVEGSVPVRTPLERLALVCLGLLMFSLPPAAPVAQAVPAYRMVAGGVALMDRTLPAAGLDRLPAARPLDLAFGLASRDPEELAAAVRAMYDPRSRSYRHFLSPSQYDARFGPDPRSVQALRGWLLGQGMVVAPWNGGHVLEARGDVAHIEAAFRVRMLRYRPVATASIAGLPVTHGSTAASTSHYLSDVWPSLPASLAPAVLGVAGLDESEQPAPLVRLCCPPHARAADSGSGRGTGGGMTPVQLQTAYDYAPLYAAGLHGEGLTVALVELAPYDLSDVQAYADQYGVSPKIVDHAVDGGAGGQASSSEAALDIEEVGSSVPAATISVYSAPNTNGVGLLAAYNALAQAGEAQVVALTWNTCEPVARLVPGFVEAQHVALTQMVAEGMSVVGSSDDSGAFSCGASGQSSFYGQVAVSLPASDPYVLGVGGTVMTLGPGDTIASETAWSCPGTQSGCGSDRGPAGEGSGGGVSILFGPGGLNDAGLSWQAGPGVKNDYSTGFRQVPDVSLSGTFTDGPDRSYSFYYQGRWQTGGGTSAATPMWAALLALTDQYLVAHHQLRLGWPNPIVYHAANNPGPYTPFHDITSGGNLYYQATPGWDYTSGWGSPDAYQFVQAVAAVAPLDPQYLPSSTATATVPPPTISPTATASPTPTSQPGSSSATGRSAAAPGATATVPATSPTRSVVMPTATRAPRTTPARAVPFIVAVPRSSTATPTTPQPTPCITAGLGNGGFESGTLRCWLAGGTPPPQVTLSSHRGGRYGALLRSPAPGTAPVALSQAFVQVSGGRPTLHVRYWLSRSVPMCVSTANCPGLPPFLPPEASVLDATGRQVAKATLLPEHLRTWSELVLFLPASSTPARYTVQIGVPAQPAPTAVLLYLDDITAGP